MPLASHCPREENLGGYHAERRFHDDVRKAQTLDPSCGSACFLAGTAVPLSGRPRPYSGLLNGRWWKNETVEIRLGFISGYAERRTAMACGDDEWFKGPAANGEAMNSLAR